ncbi:kinase-like protein [Marasmius fiardii PR-910]|nr:kinase-like protein [Marasmius fiardii PR-910]
MINLFPATAPLRSSLLTQPLNKSSVPPIEELDWLLLELKVLKEQSINRAKKAESDVKTVEDSFRRMKEREGGKGKGRETPEETQMEDRERDGEIDREEDREKVRERIGGSVTLTEGGGLPIELELDSGWARALGWGGDKVEEFKNEVDQSTDIRWPATRKRKAEPKDWNTGRRKRSKSKKWKVEESEDEGDVGLPDPPHAKSTKARAGTSAGSARPQRSSIPHTSSSNVDRHLSKGLVSVSRTLPQRAQTRAIAHPYPPPSMYAMPPPPVPPRREHRVGDVTMFMHPSPEAAYTSSWSAGGSTAAFSHSLFALNSAPVAAAITGVTNDQTTDKTGILEDICNLLQGVLKDSRRSKELVESIGEDAQLLLDTLQVLAKLPGIPTWLRSSILKTMLRLSKQSGLFPQCLIIQNVEKLGDYAVGGGGFGDVWRGKIGEQIVGLKIVKAYLTSDVQKLLKNYIREAIVWQQLEHPNVLPFMGMYYLDEAQTQLCLVSPWMEQGNLTKYLESTSGEDIDHYLLVYDIASGLAYLHSTKIVHGDMKGVNVLITPDGRACIGDFGLSRVADSRAIQFNTTATGSSTGTARWSSPELLIPPCTPSTFSDMYAFAGVCYEIFTGNVPFHGLNDGAVILAVMVKKEHPSRPELTLLNDGMWKIMVDCWNFDPQLRPTAFELPALVAGFGSFKIGSILKLIPEWDISDLGNQIWKDVKYPALDMEALGRLQRNLGSFTMSNSTP